MRLLFVKDSLSWPRSSGHDVHCAGLMRGLARLGHEVSLLTRHEPNAASLEGLTLTAAWTFAEILGKGEPSPRVRLGWLQERFRSYWGVEPRQIAAVRRAADRARADAVVVVGLNVLPYLGALDGPVRVWYAADEWAWHHLTQWRPLDRRTWENLRQAVVKGLYERAFAPLLDQVWVVSERDRQAMRWATGLRDVAVIPNGVDAEYYCPRPRRKLRRSCVFWGRLDFGPNVQALQWFCRHVWPRVRRTAPDARFSVLGFQATPAVWELAGRDGIRLVPDLPDLRGEIEQHQVVVLPFVSGGGIKNKLLEAASMRKAVVASPQALGGLRARPRPPLVCATDPDEWAGAILALWDDPRRRHRLGVAARRWVLEQHDWLAAARLAEGWLRRGAPR